MSYTNFNSTYHISYNYTHYIKKDNYLRFYSVERNNSVSESYSNIK